MRGACGAGGAVRRSLLVADGKRPEAAATGLGCSRASVSNWLAAWRAEGLAGVVEAPHPPPMLAHIAPLATLLRALLREEPQQHGHHATGLHPLDKSRCCHRIGIEVRVPELRWACAV